MSNGFSRRGFLIGTTAVVGGGCMRGFIPEVDPSKAARPDPVPDMPETKDGRWPVEDFSEEVRLFESIHDNMSSLWVHVPLLAESMDRKVPKTLKAENDRDQAVSIRRFSNEQIKYLSCLYLDGGGLGLGSVSSVRLPDGRYITTELQDQACRPITHIGDSDGWADILELRWGRGDDLLGWNSINMYSDPSVLDRRGRLEGVSTVDFAVFKGVYEDCLYEAIAYLNSTPSARGICPDLYKKVQGIRFKPVKRKTF